MARPQTEDGFVMIAIDLFPAIMAAGLSGYAQIVLAEALMQLYGPRKRETACLWPVDLNERIGMEYNNARRAIRELIEAGVLVRMEGDTYRFVKDYESWTPSPGRLESRLGGGILRWIREAVGRLGAPRSINRKNKRRQSTRTVSAGVETVYPDCPEPQKNSLPRLDRDGEKQSAQTVENPVPLKDRACVRVLGISSSSQAEEEREYQKEYTPEGVCVRELGPEYDAVILRAQEIGGDVCWGMWADRMARIGHPAREILRALNDAADARKCNMRYASGILQRRAAENYPDDRPQQRTGPRTRPAEEPARVVHRVVADPDAYHPSQRSAMP